MNTSGLFSRVDWLLVIPAFILVFLGLATLLSVSASLFTHQLVFFLISIAFYLYFSHIDIDALQDLIIPIYIVSIISLLVVLLIGFESHGAVRWIDIFGFHIQFSEIIKPFLIVALASVLSHKDTASWKLLLKIFLFAVPVLFLIYRQPDLGSALIYLGVMVLALVVYGFPWWWFGIGITTLCISIPVIWNHLHQYQRNRVLTFLHMANDPSGISYNAIQAVIAVGSGMVFGKGLGQGTQSALKFLPERTTDFLFATLSEDLGFVGSSIVIIACLLLLYRIFRIYMNTEEGYYRLVLASAMSLLFIQCFVNIGMNIGLLPIVGVTLPFVSYGGSSLLSNAILLGLVSSISSTIKRQNVLVIK